MFVLNVSDVSQNFNTSGQNTKATTLMNAMEQNTFFCKLTPWPWPCFVYDSDPTKKHL